MASSGKKKTTMAKLMRESKLRERRHDKQARKDARRQSAQTLNEQLPVTDPMELSIDGAEGNHEVTAGAVAAPSPLTT